MSHTKGPWEVTSISMENGNVNVGSRDLRIVIAQVTNAASFGDMLQGAMNRGGGGFEQDDCHTQYANARLIAAAPDLLEFVQQIFNGIDTSMIAIDTPADETLANILSRGRKALSKATGAS